MQFVARNEALLTHRYVNRLSNKRTCLHLDRQAQMCESSQSNKANHDISTRDIQNFYFWALDNSGHRRSNQNILPSSHAVRAWVQQPFPSSKKSYWPNNIVKRSVSSTQWQLIKSDFFPKNFSRFTCRCARINSGPLLVDMVVCEVRLQ